MSEKVMDVIPNNSLTIDQNSSEYEKNNMGRVSVQSKQLPTEYNDGNACAVLDYGWSRILLGPEISGASNAVAIHNFRATKRGNTTSIYALELRGCNVLV